MSLLASPEDCVTCPSASKVVVAGCDSGWVVIKVGVREPLYHV
jgi:hypothetical protein